MPVLVLSTPCGWCSSLSTKRPAVVALVLRQRTSVVVVLVVVKMLPVHWCGTACSVFLQPIASCVLICLIHWTVMKQVDEWDLRGNSNRVVGESFCFWLSFVTLNTDLMMSNLSTRTCLAVQDWLCPCAMQIMSIYNTATVTLFCAHVKSLTRWIWWKVVRTACTHTCASCFVRWKHSSCEYVE